MMDNKEKYNPNTLKTGHHLKDDPDNTPISPYKANSQDKPTIAKKDKNSDHPMLP